MTSITWRKLLDDSTVVHNSGNEMIKGDKTYEGQTKLPGGLQLLSPNGTVFNMTVN